MGLPEPSVAKTSWVKKKPKSGSSSTRLRLALGEPTSTFSWPVRRKRRALKAARTAMNGVAPSCRARAFNESARAPGISTGCSAPRVVWVAGRGRSIGSSSTWGAPASSFNQKPR